MTAHGSPYQKRGARPDPPKERQWAAMAQFFDRTLRQNLLPRGKMMFYYTLGEEAWKATDVFPLPAAEVQTWYFQPDHGLSPAPPTVDRGTHDYVVGFDATTGRFNRWHTQMARPLVYADRAAEDRRLLTYTSAPLTEDLEITGYPVVSLHLASSEDDGAFFVYLEDVDEYGMVRYITEGQLRGIHRRPAVEPAPYWTGMPHRTFRRADASPMPRGEIVELTFGLQPTSVLIRRGHAIRVALAGADKDTFARIPAQGGPVWQVSHGMQVPSCIRLPVVAR